ncbi:MAG: SDR family oxidoreductase [Gammaproteobacteria bacterium]|nr:SDR family oxidoreductase [Gammaproteobacteria bacterium]MXW44874.1 SDR family oxidoreductase [Gammaproteobacteria bacterium]MYD01999.1 SDR family oxidoreductase [Gammaproteobacteria bacterium]MYI24070.1 SDR family oxidoreductase [Gammaproteobacteria bacterium]
MNIRKLACALAAAFVMSSAAPAAELVLVAGASGRTGSAAMRLLDEQGYTVRATTTNRERAIERHGDQWDWLELDVRDRDAVFAAMQDVDYLVCATGTRSLIGGNSPRFVDYDGLVNLVDAAVEAGVRHFVVVTSAAAGPYRERSRMIIFARARHWKTMGENHLKRSGLAYTVIGPSALQEEPAAGGEPIRVMARADYETGAVAIADVAILAVDALTNPDARNKSYGVIRDESVAPGAWRAMLKTIRVDSETEEAPDHPLMPDPE